MIRLHIPCQSTCSAKFVRVRPAARDSSFVHGNRHPAGIGFRGPPLPFSSVRVLPKHHRQPVKGKGKQCLRQRKYNLKSTAIWN